MSDDHRSEVTGQRGAKDTSGMPGAWLLVLRRYVIAITLGNLVWEFAQLPLYTIWHEGSAQRIAFAAVHCTGGDVLIAGSALVGSLLVFGEARWPYRRYPAVAAAAILGGLAYTIFSEWLNTEVRGSWAYSRWMPQLPLIGTGLAPLAQWLIIPPLALWWARRPLVPQAKEVRTGGGRYAPQ